MDQEHKSRIILHSIEAGLTFSRYVAWLAGIWVAGHFLVEAIGLLAGRQTDASFVLKLIWNLSADRWIAYLVGVLGASFGLNERRLKRRNIERLTKAKTELEERLDKNRTSSGLNPDGSTRDEDK